MSVPSLLVPSWAEVWAAVIATVGIYVTVIAATRVLGLRTFAKMSSFDFAATIATGSIIASIALTATPLVLGVVAIAVLFAAQGAVAWLRRRRGAQKVIDNSPILLMRGTQIIEHHMREAKVTEDDLFAKLRESGVTQMVQVRYVVLEATGDISVLKGDPDDPPVEPRILTGVTLDQS